MLKNNGVGSSNKWSRVCDTCHSAACIVYCLADSLYLCSLCDAKFHAPNCGASWHERVWVCEICESAPAAFLCKVDAATLCSSCDAHIHNSNSQASCHHRVPILPIIGSLLGEEQDHDIIDLKDMSLELKRDGYEAEKKEEEVFNEVEDVAEAASWLLPNPVQNSDENEENNIILYGDNNQFSGSQYNDKNSYSVVSQEKENYAEVIVVPVQIQQQSQQFQLGLDIHSFEFGLSCNDSSVGVVPESAMSDVSIPHSKPLTIGTSDLFPHIQRPFTTLEREAKVLRYREKKKTRKFEKKIMYASRKAYAETRPRIKGRFVKETDVEETGYGIVPSELFMNIQLNGEKIEDKRREGCEQHQIRF
ncbi:hypothetical protein TanjilG_01378 [Lupinus angustifolius]|nr:hypothetical protein TanjilG_01378 [Lupinus angustifolius]